MLKGRKTFLFSVILILIAIVTGVLDKQGYLPGEVAIAIYGAVLPIITITLRTALKAFEKETQASIHKTQESLDETKELIKSLEAKIDRPKRTRTKSRSTRQRKS